MGSDNTRAREVIRSILQRIDRPEAGQFEEDSTTDAFNGVPPRSNA